MTATALLSLLPILIISLTLIVVMLVIPFNRNHAYIALISFTGLLIALLTLPVCIKLAPVQATPLLLIDGFALFFMGLMLGTSLLLTTLCYDYFKARLEYPEEFYLLLLLATLGALILISSSHFATLFLGIELITLPVVVMVAYPFSNRYGLPLESGIKYFILSAAASALLLFGIALIYVRLGSLNFGPLSQFLDSRSISDDPLLQAGLMLALAGIGFKLALVPFHLWIADVYQGAPAPTAAFLSTLSEGAVLVVLLRYFIASEAYRVDSLIWVMSALAIASMLVGNLLALRQRNIKRVLAYSSIAHFGYMLVALVTIATAVDISMATETVSYYLTAYLITTLGAFGVVIRLSSGHQEEICDLDDYQGLLWRQPLLATLFTLVLISLAGIPMTVGFIGKFYIFNAAVSQALWPMLIAVVIASALGLFVYLRIILVMARSPKPSAIRTTPVTWGAQFTLVILGLLILCLGVFPAPLMETIQSLALTL